METQQPYTKAQLTEVNSYLTCYLCKGYYIDATTIVECLHSFCRSCIIRHLQQKSYCPVCDLMINTAKPNIKLDKTLQDIVYKLVPGLYASEMCRRRIFWAGHPEATQKVSCPEARGQTTERIIFSPQDAISLSIEYTSDDLPDWNQNNPISDKKQGLGVPLRRYLQCPAMLRVEHLKKFIYNKYNIENRQFHVDILHKRVPLPDHYTLMDIAYIYSWKRNEPMKFFFRITDINLVSERFDYFEPSATIIEDNNIPTPVRCRGNKHHSIDKSTPNKAASLSDISSKDNSRGSAKVKLIKTEIVKKCDNGSINIRQTVNQNGGGGATVLQQRHDLKSKVIPDVINDVPTEVKCKVDSVTQNSEVNTSVKLNNGGVTSEVNCLANQTSSEINVKLNVVSEKQSKSAESTKLTPDSKVTSSKLSSKSNESKVPNIISVNKTFPKTMKKSAAKSMSLNIIPKHSSILPEPSSNRPRILSKSVPKSPNLHTVSPAKVFKTPSKLTGLVASSLEDKSCEMAKPDPYEFILPEVVPDDLDLDKTQFLNSIQLTPRTSPTSPAKTRKPDITKPVVSGQKRKYVFKTDRALAKKAKLDVKLRKILPKGNGKNAADLKTKNIKDPLVRLMVSNMNKQASKLTKIVGQDISPPNNLIASKTDQTDGNTNLTTIAKHIDTTANMNLTNFGQINTKLHINMTKNDQTETISSLNDQNERLQSLIDSCKINIPSSLSITLTESTRGEDGSVENKPTSIKPVLNYIEILKLPESNIPKFANDQNVKSEAIVDTPKKSDALKSDADSKAAQSSASSKNQKQTFQTMFEEAIKRNESMRAHLFHIQNQAKLAKKQLSSASATSANPLKLRKQQQNNALDLSTTSSNSECSVSPTPPSSIESKQTENNSETLTKSPKRNILEIAHQLSKRSKLDLAVPNLIVPSDNRVSPKKDSPEPKQIIVNSNFSSGGFISIKDSPATIKTNLNTSVNPGKVPIPRLPIGKVPTPKLNPPNIRNGSLVKVGTYSPKMGTNTVKNGKVSPATAGESTQQLLSPNQLLEKYNIGNLAQLNANINQAQYAFQQAVIMSHQMEMQRIHQINNQKQNMLNNPNILAHYENYVQSLKNQQNVCGTQSNKN